MNCLVVALCRDDPTQPLHNTNFLSERLFSAAKYTYHHSTICLVVSRPNYTESITTTGVT